MSSSKNTFIAFLLNLCFSIIEFIFGALFNSSAILADAVHDFGDALAIGSSALMQTFANKPADSTYPLGYKRWNILAALLTSSILIIGSSLILVENIPNLFHPQPINQDGMLVLGVIAIIINFAASRIVKNGHSHNESILSLHFLEDILGWLAVILVSIILQFTDWYFLDPLLSIIISLFILSQALPKAWNNLKIFLEQTPSGIKSDELALELLSIPNVESIVQLKVWTMDGYEHCATLTVKLTNHALAGKTKERIRNSLITYGILQITIETV